MNENDKQKKICEHKEVLEGALNKIDETKTKTQKLVTNGKEICVFMDEAKDNVKKELGVVQSLTPAVISHINDEQWGEYERIRDRDMLIYGSVTAFSQEIDKRGNQVAAMTSTASTFPLLIGSSVTSAVGTLSSIPEPGFQAEIQKIEMKDTTFDHVEFIKNELRLINPQIAEDFARNIQDWSSSKADQKYKVLLNLRSNIFSQLLDSISPEAKYCKTLWFKNSKNKKKIFCQVKFLILGFHDEQSLPQSTVVNINSIASDLKTHFHNMSEFGKLGKRGIAVENLFRETISSFSIALKLRKQFYKPTI